MKNFALFILLFALLAIVTDARRTTRSNTQDSNDDTDDGESLVRAGKLYEARYKRGLIQKAQVEKLYNNVVYPACSFIGAEILKRNYSAVADYLTENVQGRVSPLGRFDTYFLTGEYFYGLAGPLPGASTVGRTRVVSINWTIPILCWNNTCRWRVNVEFKRFSDNSTANIFTHAGFANFDSTNRICTYEANFVGMDRQLNLAENATIRQAAIRNLCNGLNALCTGANKQFNNTTECIAFMNTKEYGGWGKSDQDTWQCRNLHLILARDDPDTHCPHSGPSGGGRCIVNSELTYRADDTDGCRDPVF